MVGRAQNAARVRVVGVVSGASADDPDLRAPFVRALAQLGWTEEHDLRIEYRWGEGNTGELRKQVEELVSLAPDVILARGGPAMDRLSQTTSSVPVVFVIVPDPVGSGFVESLSRPGGNATGFMQFEYSLCAKWPELLKQIAPNVTRVSALRDPISSSGIGQFAVIQSVAPTLGVEAVPINAAKLLMSSALSPLSRIPKQMD